MSAENKLVPPNNPDTSPFFGLPFEIISEIFVHCLPEVQTALHKSEAPLLLGCICREWRDAALDTPTLWTCLFISETAEKPGIALLADLWLSRARGLPLTIGIRSEDMDIPESLLHTICNYSSQWADLELPLSWQALSQLDLAVEGPLSILRRLSIGLERYLVEPPPITAFRDAPMLREVHLVLGPVLLRTIVLPWAQLTSFTGHGFFLVECLTVLGRTSSLAECSFVACYGERRPTADILAPLSGIKLLRLEEPDVRRNVVDLLSYLTLPSLQSLELKTMKGLADLKFALQVLLSFLTRSECPLRELCLMSSQTFPKLGELLSRCLRAMPFLEILEIVENTKSPLGVTAILGHLHASSNLLPRLRSFSIRYGKTVASIPYEDLFDMLSSRSGAENADSAPVQKFALVTNSGTPRPDAPTLDCFRELIEKGMKIHLGPRDLSWV